MCGAYLFHFKLGLSRSSRSRSGRRDGCGLLGTLCSGFIVHLNIGHLGLQIVSGLVMCMEFNCKGVGMG